jgi:hypothetical protein
MQPGLPCPGGFAFAPISFAEGMNGSCPAAELTGPVPLPSPVAAGFLVLVEDVTRDPKDPSNWSDVLAFNDLHHAPTVNECDAFATYISSCGVAGITDAELVVIGVTTADVVNGNTLFVLESTSSSLNTYGAGLNLYYLYSDPGVATPTRRSSWGALKSIYR